MKMPLREELRIASTGDPEQDVVALDSAMRSLQRRSEGVCPNDGKTHLVRISDHDRVCPKCGFSEESDVPFP